MICAREICVKFVYKHSETIAYVLTKLVYFLRNLQTSRAITNFDSAKFPGYCFNINTNKQRDFQICISVPSIKQFSGILWS